MNIKDAKVRRKAPLKTPTDLGADATKDIAGALNILLADIYALYFKTKNFHWHISGPHFRDYHVLLDEQGDQIYALADTIALRLPLLGPTVQSSQRVSIGHKGTPALMLFSRTALLVPRKLKLRAM
jgi:starvation-inducible DNA-binding protein